MVATANDIRSLPPELLRKGRFNELFFVDLPDAEDRREIIQLYHRRYLGRAAEPHELDQLADLSEGFAGSGTEAALHEVGEEAHLHGGLDQLPSGLAGDTFANTVPLGRTNPEQIEEIRAWGRERALPAGRGGGTGEGRRPARRRIVFADD
nr:hypothetical protein [Streptomyces albidoflavus]